MNAANIGTIGRCVRRDGISCCRWLGNSAEEKLP